MVSQGCSRDLLRMCIAYPLSRSTGTKGATALVGGLRLEDKIEDTVDPSTRDLVRGRTRQGQRRGDLNKSTLRQEEETHRGSPSTEIEGGLIRASDLIVSEMCRIQSGSAVMTQLSSTFGW
jgi:hypothetical protein